MVCLGALNGQREGGFHGWPPLEICTWQGGGTAAVQGVGDLAQV